MRILLHKLINSATVPCELCKALKSYHKYRFKSNKITEEAAE